MRIMGLFAWLPLVLGCGSVFDLTYRGDGPVKDHRVAANPVWEPGPGDRPDPQGKQLELGGFHFSSCSEIQTNIGERIRRQRDQLIDARSQPWGPRGAEDFVMDSVGSATPESVAVKASEASFTNVQVEGVDEADYVKIGKSQIYVFVPEGRRIRVVERETLHEVGSIVLEDLQSSAQGYGRSGLLMSDFWFDPVSTIEMFLTAKRLVVLESDYSQVRISIFELNEGVPVKVRDYSLQGRLIDSRMVRSELLVITSEDLQEHLLIEPLDYSWTDDQLSSMKIPEVVVAQKTHNGVEKIEGVPCHRIGRPVFDDDDLVLTKVSRYAVNEDKEPTVAALLGGGDHVYMTMQNLYVAKSQPVWRWWSGESDLAGKTVISQVVLSEADLGVGAVGLVPGYVKDQWAFHEMRRSSGLDSGEETYLAVATTSRSTGFNWGGDLENHLSVLQSVDGELVTAALTEPFGKTEDIRAVRYINDVAYIVTFKKTDPLFAFDLTDPTNPVLLDALKIPGFSTYMHPMAGGRMVGVGFDALEQGSFALFQGIQVSLFDIQDPRELSRLDVKIHGGRGSSSEVTANHHAFFAAKDQRTFALPIVELAKNDENSWAYGGEVEFTGAVVYLLNGDSLVEVARVSHSDWMPHGQSHQASWWWNSSGRSSDINRIYEVDGRMLTVSRWGIKAHDLSDPTEILQATKFQP